MIECAAHFRWVWNALDDSAQPVRHLERCRQFSARLALERLVAAVKLCEKRPLEIVIACLRFVRFVGAEDCLSASQPKQGFPTNCVS